MSSHPKLSRKNDIIVLPPNLQGEDKIIGDLHGNLTCLRVVLRTLSKHDRLFMAGDLIDRGEQSPEIIPAILAFQRAHPNQLYAVKGNHELLFINAIHVLETMFASLTEETYWSDDNGQLSLDAWLNDFMNQDAQALEKLYSNSNIQDLRLYVVNGGAWLVYLFRQEVEHGLIDLNEEGKIIYAEQSVLVQIINFINTLPYLIHVSGSMPFNVIHADMPLSDLALEKKCADSDLTLTEEQREYAVWAREHGGILFADQGRSKQSTRTFVGHSIIAFGLANVVRDTNTINLDIATFKTNMCLVVSHHAKTCELIGPGVDQAYKYPALNLALQQLTSYLRAND